ncbi:MAG TPA: NAD(P)-dependent oxidoreductase [Spirochaetia bacterium]|nr:NAD(P)-dependent oxidoreductase [Spirochaetia bacterium]
MPLTEEEIRLLPDLTGVRLACSIHLEPKVGPSLEGLRDHGASLFLTTCNPATVRDELVERLRSLGAEARAWHGMSGPEAREAERLAWEWKPTHLWEMGASLVGSQPPGNGAAVIAGMECTGSGIARLRALVDQGIPPRFPVFNCDEVPIKEGLHNRYLVGFTAWHTFTDRTRLGLHGKRVLVVGYGPVGRGVALTARALGGDVDVAERDPARALEARYDGFTAGPLEELAGRADVLVTATGARGVVSARVLGLLPDGCFLMNVGHNNDEIDVAALGPLRQVIPFVEEARVQGKALFLVAHGTMANLAAGQGDTLNSFDITMATMLAGVRFTLSEEARTWRPGLHVLPRSAWEGVATRAAASR